VVAAPDELGTLCRDLVELREIAAEQGRSAELEALLADLLAGTDTGDRRVELMRQLGIPAGTPRDIGTRVPGLRDARPTAEVYECPTRSCSRAYVRAPGGAVPACAVHEAPMRPRRGRR
jgi:hypothetical protein